MPLPETLLPYANGSPQNGYNVVTESPKGLLGLHFSSSAITFAILHIGEERESARGKSAPGGVGHVHRCAKPLSHILRGPLSTHPPAWRREQ